MNNQYNGDIEKMIKNGASKSDVDKMIKKLSPEDTKKLNEMLNDKQAMDKLLSDPKVQAMIKLLGGKKNG